jgi:hypothetical protein
MFHLFIVFLLFLWFKSRTKNYCKGREKKFIFEKAGRFINPFLSNFKQGNLPMFLTIIIY